AREWWQVTREETEPNRARRDERDLERERRIAIVLRARELVRLRAHVPDVRLVERVARLSRVALPPKHAHSRCGVELCDASPDEVELVGLLEVFADVDQVAP